MIEHLRKYTGAIIFVIALLFVGLAFFGDNASMGGGNPGDPPAIAVDGRTYSYNEFKKTGESSRSLAMTMGLYEFISTLGGFGGDDAQTDQRFFANRLILQQARKDFGVHPSKDEVDAAMKAMPTFQGENGSFDQARFNEIVTKGIGRFGMDEQDLRALVSDSIAAKKLAAIIGGGLSADRTIAAEQVASRDQQVAIQLSRISLAKFQEALKPTDEELQTEWNTTKEKYLTERRVKVTYVIAKPKYPELPKEEIKLPEAVTEEQKKEAEKAAADKKAADEAKLAEEKRRIDNELADVVDTFLLELEASQGKDFDKLVAENNWEPVATDFFPRTAVPTALAVNLRSASNPTPVGDLLFRLALGTEPMTRYTDALPVADGAFIVARLDEDEVARPKSFEEAKEQVRTDYLAAKAGEALKKDADAKAATIREGLTAKKPFADLAKELGLEVKSHGPFKATDKLDGEADVTLLFETASMTDPGTLADPVMRPDGALFIFVEKRELVKDPARGTRVETALSGLASNQQRIAFSAWLNEKLEATKIEDLLKKP